MSLFKPRRTQNIEDMQPPSTRAVLRKLTLDVDDIRLVLIECPECWALILKGQFLAHIRSTHGLTGAFRD